MKITIFKGKLSDLDNRIIQEIKQQFGPNHEVEIHIRSSSLADALLSEETFWQIIDKIDWSKTTTEGKLESAVKLLSEMPVSHIYSFADRLSEKLFLLDTKWHAQAFSARDPEAFLSVDDFLYARCGVVAEGREFFEKVLKTPSRMPDSMVFEPVLNLADLAFKLKTGLDFDYHPVYNWETYSNKTGWN